MKRAATQRRTAVPKNRYIVVFFDNTSVEEWAYSEAEATIYAQYARLQAGKDYAVKEVQYIGPLPS